MGEFFFEVANRAVFCFQVSFFPVKRENRAGSSRNEFDYTRERYPDQFLASRLSQLREFWTTVAHFSIFLLEKKKLIKQSPLFDHLSVF